MAGPSPIDRKLYGDMADDICLLRSDGRIVARYKDGFRVDSWPEIFSAAQIRGMAATVRNRRMNAQTAPRVTKAGHEIPDAPRSRMAAHRITRTAELDTRSSGGSTGTPSATRAGSAAAVHSEPCTRCGGPRSKWSKEQCATCYAQAGRGSYSQKPTADVPDKFWRAVGPTKSCGPVRPVGEPTVAGGPPSHRIDAPVLDAGTSASAGETAGRAAPGPQELSPSQQVASPSHHVRDVTNMVGSDQSVVTSKLVEPAPEVARPSLPASICPCGRPRGHGGRCWHQRGQPGPKLKRAPQQGPRCAGPGCTAQLSYGARGDLCRKCHLATVRKDAGTAARIAALEAEIATMKADLAAFEAKVKAAVADLCAHLGLGQGR